MHRILPKCTLFFRNAPDSRENAPDFFGNAPCAPKFAPCFFGNAPWKTKNVVRKPISNKIIKIGSRTVYFSFIFRAFFDLPVLRRKSKTVKNWRRKNVTGHLISTGHYHFCHNTWPQTVLGTYIQETSALSVHYSIQCNYPLISGNRWCPYTDIDIALLFW